MQTPEWHEERRLTTAQVAEPRNFADGQRHFGARGQAEDVHVLAGDHAERGGRLGVQVGLVGCEIVYRQRALIDGCRWSEDQRLLGRHAQQIDLRGERLAFARDGRLLEHDRHDGRHASIVADEVFDLVDFR